MCVIVLLRVSFCVCILTLGLLTLAWGLPANAGAMLIQVEESHQPFGSSLQLHHLCPGLHHTHASLHWKRKKKKRHVQTQTLGSVEHYAKIQREQVPGLICLWRKHDKVSQCHTISRAADVGPSPKVQQRCFCVNTQGCFSVRHWATETNGEGEGTRRDFINGKSANQELNVQTY